MPNLHTILMSMCLFPTVSVYMLSPSPGFSAPRSRRRKLKGWQRERRRRGAHALRVG